MVGAIIAGPLADRLGRRVSIVFWDVIFIVGVIIQIATNSAWVQLAIGRLVAGFGVGGLSVSILDIHSMHVANSHHLGNDTNVSG